jgi:hypothetical protein
VRTEKDLQETEVYNIHKLRPLLNTVLNVLTLRALEKLEVS